ncbi:MAG: rod shape-determining protein MreC [Clostridia bacterium]|nr:rod shape-determining protein MreC [Clostridia bacterium]
MNRFLKNKFFLITLAVALTLSLSATILAVMGVNDPVRNLFGTITLPVRWCASKIAEGIDGYRVYFNKIDELVEQNKALRDENAELREQLAESELAARQDDYLREYLDLPWLVNDWSLTDATVIGREASSYRTTYTLNRGSLHGIKKGMPVVTAQGVVGSVAEVGLSYCRVVSIIETASSVGVYAKRSGASGLLVGDMKLRADGMCLITYIEADADIKVGDLIVTAGTGSIYPAELTVGTVVELIPDDVSRMLTATVRPAAELEGLGEVMIITDYQIKPYSYDDIDPSLGEDTDAEHSEVTE